MEYHNAVKHLLFIVTISLYSVASAPLTTWLPSQASTTPPQERPCRSELLASKLSPGDSTLSLPRCDQQGYFKALQIKDKKLQCVTAELGWPIDARSRYSESGPCKALKKCVKKTEAPGSSDHKLIRCDKEGFFKLIQRTETGKICVNSYGIITKEMNVTKSSDCSLIAKEKKYNKDSNTITQKGNNKTNYKD